MVMQINNASRPDTEKDTLISMLFEKQILTQSEFDAINKQATLFQQTIFEYLLQYHFIRAEKFSTITADFLKTNTVTLEKTHFFDLPTNALPFSIIKNNLILPIAKKDRVLEIAISNPNDFYIGKNIAFQLGLSVKIMIARYDTLCRLHNAYISEQQYRQRDEKNNLLAQQITHQLLSDAIHRNASDIHIEPFQSHLRVRFRIDGLLHTITQFPTQFIETITSCLKILAHLDIAIKRMPQDGRLTFRSYLGFFKDCRVSTCPTQHGEKMVIRLLDANTQIRPINKLGLSKKNRALILNAIAKPQGLILVTGPTGSGKTITLYTLLNLLNQSHRNITTIEDPIEMQIDGINQTSIHSKMGLTFSHTLRALLRQDPDVMMIGEIRDQETAEMAIRAAQTGHLVLSTLHTNNAAEAITRLCHMGIAPYHLASALTLIIAQRLARKLCVQCKSIYQPSSSILNEVGFSDDLHHSLTVFQAKGCTQCTDGYQGRTGIFEVLPITNTIKQIIYDRDSVMKLEAENNQSGQMSLWEAALFVVKTGETTLDEIYRVVQRVEV